MSRMVWQRYPVFGEVDRNPRFANPPRPAASSQAPEESHEQSDFTSRKGLNSLGSLAQRFQRPWSGDVPSGESENPVGRAMAEEPPKAPEPEISIAPEGEAKTPARPRNLYAFVKQARRDPRGGVVEQTHFRRMLESRRGNAFVRIDRTTRCKNALGMR